MNALTSFVQDELASLIVTLAFLAALTALLMTGVFARDDVLVASIMTLIASYWFNSAAHRAGGAAANSAAERAVQTLLTTPAPIPVTPVPMAAPAPVPAPAPPAGPPTS